jgi:DNA-binding HxlR family transcriptional regulator
MGDKAKKLGVLTHIYRISIVMILRDDAKLRLMDIQRILVDKFGEDGFNTPRRVLSILISLKKNGIIKRGKMKRKGGEGLLYSLTARGKRILKILDLMYEGEDCLCKPEEFPGIVGWPQESA